jgi:hypothetical protein
MTGRLYVLISNPSSWTMNKVIAMDRLGRVIGETVPSKPGMTWSMPSVAEEGQPGIFWVEMSDITGVTHYNEGLEVVFTAGGYYPLNITESNIPLGNASALALIGRDAAHPLNKSYILLRDIRLSGVWKPLCETNAGAFSGRFNGRGFTISGLTLPDNSAYESIGFFGYVRGGSITNLNLKTANRELTVPPVNGQCTGVLAGFAENTVISRVTVSGPSEGLIIRKTGGGDFYAGGIAGKISGASSVISLSAALFSIVVEADSAGTGYAGGIAGYCDQTGAAGSSSIEKCYSTGLTAASNRGGGVFAGGITGYHKKPAPLAGTVSITECYASGDVSASGGAGIAAAGGLVGGCDSAFGASGGLTVERSCVLVNSVSASSITSTLVYAGGLSGYNLAGTGVSYQLDTLKLQPAQAAPAIDAADTIGAADISTAWLDSPPLNWDFSGTWKWDAVRGAPKFLWQ